MTKGGEEVKIGKRKTGNIDITDCDTLSYIAAGLVETAWVEMSLQG